MLPQQICFYGLFLLACVHHGPTWKLELEKLKNLIKRLQKDENGCERIYGITKTPLLLYGSSNRAAIENDKQKNRRTSAQELADGLLVKIRESVTAQRQ